jgi:small GTP-binding protein
MGDDSVSRAGLAGSAGEARIAAVSELLTQTAALVSAEQHEAADLQALQASLAVLQEFFLIVVAGEFNAGKSSLINALLRAAVLPEGVTPTTDAITRLRYAETAQSELGADGIRRTGFPAAVLHRLTIVDTPGTNAVIRRHEQLTRDYVPRADLVLFITAADRPFTESERAFLELIRSWGKQVVIVLNKIDILLPDEERQVEQFVRDNAQQVLGMTPAYFAVSARLAQLAAASPDAAVAAAQRADSRLDALEQYVVTTLDDAARLRLKLLAPLGTAQRVLTTTALTVSAQLTTLSGDLAVLDNLERQLSGYRDGLTDDAAFSAHAIDRLLAAAGERGERYLAEQLRLRNLRGLLDQPALSAGFSAAVSGPLAGEIDQQLQALADRLVERYLRLQQDSDGYIRQRAAAHREQLIGELGGPFELNRQTLLREIGGAAQQVLAGYDRDAEAAQLAERIRQVLAAGVLSGISGLGLGTVLVLLLQTIALDISGIAAAVGVAALGWAYLPYQRRAAQARLRMQIDQLRSRMHEQIGALAVQEAQRSAQQIRLRNEPFARFVRSAHQQLEQRYRALQQLREQVETMTATIDGTGKQNEAQR